MAVYVNRTTAAGTVRLGVLPRRNHDPGEHDGRLSTGADGEFRQLHEDETLFFSEQSRIEDDPRGSEPEQPSTILSLFRPEPSLRGVLSFGAMIVGLLLIVLGVAVVVRKGPAGWVEIVLGTVLLALPLVATIRRNQILRKRIEQERQKRAEAEARNREIAGALTDRFDAIGAEHDQSILTRIRREREEHAVPHEALASAARAAALRAGYGSLSRFESTGAEGLAHELTAVAESVGLSEEDRKRVSLQLYQSAFWHLAADDRLTDFQHRRLETLRGVLQLSDADVARELQAAADLRDLRGIDTSTLPEVESVIALRFQERCFHQTSGHVLKRRRTRGNQSSWKEGDPCHLLITSRRLLVDWGKRIEIPRIELYGAEVDLDENVLSLETVDRKVYHLRIPDPIFTAVVAEIASTLPDKPAGLI